MKHAGRLHQTKNMFMVEHATDQMGMPLPKKEFLWLSVHPRDNCIGDEFCGIHNPSPSHINDEEWPYSWRADIGVMERLCPHEIGHPDPDGLAFQIRKRQEAGKYVGAHGCDGCCQTNVVV